MYANALFDFIKKSPCASLAFCEIRRRLEGAGFKEADVSEVSSLPKGKYYFSRGGASIIAIRLPQAPKRAVIAAAHTDSPALRVKQGSGRVGCYVSIPVERYGGLIPYSWFDRPLSVAGRVMLSAENGVEERIVNVDRALCYIPNPGLYAPTNNTQNGATFNMAKDMLPLLSAGGAAGDLMDAVAEAGGFSADRILAHDLFVYVRDEGCIAGKNGEFLLCPRLDDLACAFAATEAFLTAKESDTLSVLALFDHEEIGSTTERGADSGFFSAVLSPFLGRGKCFAESSLLVSADNAHAVHPNFPELSDNVKEPVAGGGVAVKWSASHTYSTEASAGAIFLTICKNAHVPCQTYQNRADMRGGSTLGSIANTHLGISALDIGIPQLAMHSAVESCAVKDLEYMVNGIRACYEARITKTESGYEIL